MDRLLPDGSAPHYDDKQTRSMFTASEDKKLLKLVEEAGKKPNWRAISIIMKTRTPRQCRERYQNYLNPSLEHENWTPDEDQLIMEKFQELGPKWNLIAKFLHGRTGNATRNRYQSLQRKLRKQEKLRKQNLAKVSNDQTNSTTIQQDSPAKTEHFVIPPPPPLSSTTLFDQQSLPFPPPPPLKFKYENLAKQMKTQSFTDMMEPQNLLASAPKIIVCSQNPKAIPPELQFQILIHQQIVKVLLKIYLYNLSSASLGLKCSLLYCLLLLFIEKSNY